METILFLFAFVTKSNLLISDYLIWDKNKSNKKLTIILMALWFKFLFSWFFRFMRRVMMIVQCYWNASKIALQFSSKPSSFTWKRNIGSAYKNTYNTQISIPLFTRIRRKKWYIIREWDRENWSVILTLSFRRFYSLQRHISYNLLFLHVITSFHNLWIIFSFNGTSSLSIEILQWFTFDT